MKVLEKGREQRGWASEFICTGVGNGGGGCGAKLLVEEVDVYLTVAYAHADTDYFTTFRCCECQVETDIASKDIPSRIKHTLLTEHHAKTRA